MYNNSTRKVVLKKRDKIVDKRVSVCTDCRAGIFKGQEYYWAKGKGLVHTHCRSYATAS